MMMSTNNSNNNNNNTVMLKMRLVCLYWWLWMMMLLLLLMASTSILPVAAAAYPTAAATTSTQHRHLQQQEDTKNKEKKVLKFGMASGGSSFFDPVKEGWFETCQRKGVECTYFTDTWPSKFFTNTISTFITSEEDVADFNITDFLLSNANEEEDNTDELLELQDIDIYNLTNITLDRTDGYAPCILQIRYFIQQQYDGISIQCGGANHPTIYQEVYDAGIPIVSFDIPPPLTQPVNSYIGTDNYYLGKTMARLLRVLKPEGGTYHVVSFTRIPERYQGFVKEIEKYNHRDDKPHWYKVTKNYTQTLLGDNLTVGHDIEPSEDSPFFTDSTLTAEERNYYLQTGRYENLQRISSYNPTAIIFLYQTPMRITNYTLWVEGNRWRNITIVGTQGSNDELELMARRQVDGLVGQVTYDMGRISLETLYNLATTNDGTAKTATITTTGEIETDDNGDVIVQYDRTYQYTKLINYNLVLEELPPTDIDYNLLGKLNIVGLTCFGIVAVCVVGCCAWSIYYRNSMVVKASQPFFLLMTLSGVFIMASSLVPLSFDDDGGDHDSRDDYDYENDNLGKDDGLTEFQSTMICMSVPWLALIGFTITFSALFAKTWRVNQFFKSKNSLERIQVTERDVLQPFFLILSLNVIVLLCWTIIDPLRFVREYDKGLDIYNREIASVGYCRSESHALAYIIPLALINFSLLVTACIQAFEARDIKSEFAEAKYIGITIFSLAQAFITGIPMVAIVKDIPEAYYLVLTFIIFGLSMVILLLIFLPKIYMQRRYSKLSVAEQRRAMAISVRLSTGLPASQISGLNLQTPNSSKMMNREMMANDKNDDEHPNDDDGSSKPSIVKPLPPLSTIASQTPPSSTKEKGSQQHQSSNLESSTDLSSKSNTDMLFGSIVERIDDNDENVRTKRTSYLPASEETIDA